MESPCPSVSWSVFLVSTTPNRLTDIVETLYDCSIEPEDVHKEG